MVIFQIKCFVHSYVEKNFTYSSKLKNCKRLGWS